MSFSVLFENADLVVAVKPAGVLSASDAGRDFPSLLAAALHLQKLYPIHRLDRQVGGVCVLAKHEKAAAECTAALGAGAFQKTYLAVTCGVPAEPSATLCDLLYHDKRTNKTFIVTRERRGVKPASLSYRVLASTGDHALVEVQLHTGRTHQIRVQFASRGYPLLGDRKYGGIPAPAIGLFAKTLSLPIGGEQRSFTAPTPESAPFLLFS